MMFIHSRVQVRTGTITQERQSPYTLIETFVTTGEEDVQ